MRRSSSVRDKNRVICDCFLGTAGGLIELAARQGRMDIVIPCGYGADWLNATT
jgi:hypothetical protein